MSRILCQPHEVSHAGSDNNDIEFSTFSRHFDFDFEGVTKEIHGGAERVQGYPYILFSVHEENTSFQSADLLFVVARISLFCWGSLILRRFIFYLFDEMNSK